MKRLLLLLLATTGCATFSPERGHDQVEALVQERTGLQTGWGEGEPGAEDIADRVEKLLAEGLTRQRAIEIALVNNPEIQATYAGLGVSQADLVDAGRISNPVIEGSVGFPITESESDRIEYEASIVQNFLDLFVLPLRQRVAKEQFIADTVQVAHETLGLAAEVSRAFSRYQAADRMVELQRLVMQAALGAAAEMEARFRAGNVTQLDLDIERAAYEQARAELARAELERIEAREELNRHLGLWGQRTAWTLAEPLPEMLPEEPLPEKLESLAIRQRLDVDAARKQYLLLENAVGVAKSSRYFGFIEIGVHIHQDPDGPRLFGPTLALELPIFNQRQGTIARLESQQRQAARRLDALSVGARAAVRTSAARLQGLRQIVDHQRKLLLPLRERIVEGMQLQYNAMAIGMAEVMEARREQIEAYRAYVETVRDYWIERAELERLVGGSLRPPPRDGPAPQRLEELPAGERPDAAGEEEHHQHEATP
ncbi:TolC family protein [Vulgatibacter sp.]|uniref:TolC family protein n=1 Tax=Vulgatibacter sp. TaxID=1971226 RepID=UPI0035662DB1